MSDYKNLIPTATIPSGTFFMGSPDDDPQACSDEKPQHEVTIDYEFEMGITPITQGQWQAVMGNNPSHFKGEDRPVENVTWDDATEFCKKLSELTGEVYRLPSEAEWEYACRAGTTTRFWCGDELTKDVAVFSDSETKPTGPGYGRKPNQFGLYDTHGNVWEWCKDDWHDNYEGAPTDGSAWLD
jgi:formylglycine-generating enzyme required for sulfatase activity